MVEITPEELKKVKRSEIKTCKGCEKRHYKCHEECHDYAIRTAIRKALSDEYKTFRMIDDVVLDSVKRCAGNRGKDKPHGGNIW